MIVFQSEVELKKEELEIRKFEAETTRRQMEMEHKARMEEIELKRASESAQALERQAMTHALLELIKKK